MSGDVGSCHANDDPISWLDQSVTKEVLYNSCNIHNNLPLETSLPINEEDHLDQLREIILSCEAADNIGVIALHQHEELLPGHSSVGHSKKRNNEYYYMVRQLPNKTIPLKTICGHKYAYVEGKGLCPFEFREGEMLDLSGVDKTIFRRIGQYFAEHNLTSRLGLELLIPELSKKKMTELGGKLLADTALLSWKDVETVKTCWKWDKDQTGIYDVGVYCVINKTGKHEKLVTEGEGVDEIADFVDLAQQVGLLRAF